MYKVIHNMDGPKAFIVGFLTVVFTAVSPLMTSVYLLLAGVIFNTALAKLIDLRNGKKHLRMPHIWKSVQELIFYFALMFFMDSALRMHGDVNAAINIQKYITYILIYFYILGIIEKGLVLFPESQALKFMKMVLNIEILPRLRAYAGKYMDQQTGMDNYYGGLDDEYLEQPPNIRNDEEI